MAISVRGVARKYLNRTGALSVRAVFYGGNPSYPASLRDTLRSLARKQNLVSVSECIYGWTAAFEQTWSHILIRIRLNPDAGISAATVTALQNTWRNGIVTTWSNRWAVAHAGEMTLPLTCEVNWDNSNPHHTVRIRSGSFRSNMTTWDTQDDGGVAAHECGHMLGLVDEYADSTCPNRSPVNTGTVMDNNSTNVPSRLMTRFANNLGCSVVAL